MSISQRIVWGATFVIMSSASLGSVIDDKSQFVGDFTVIDFETRGDGTPYVFPEGRGSALWKNEYASLGVSIIGSGNTLVVNPAVSPHFDAAHALVGSLPNIIATDGEDRFLRFEFSIPVNAIALAGFGVTESEPARLQVYSDTLELIEAVDFAGGLIDGTVPGVGFGNPYDIDYGFFGVFTGEHNIASALVTIGNSSLDDLYFGVIPEPGTLMFFGLFGAIVLRRRRREGTRQLSCLGLVLLVFSGVNVSALGSVIDDKSQFVGDFTVIDFETRGDGTPYDLPEGWISALWKNEYASLGVSIIGSGNALVVNPAVSPHFDTTHALFGSPPNIIVTTGEDRFLRFEFSIPVNAIGLAASTTAGAQAPRWDIYDNGMDLIESLEFGESLVDGTVPGSEFGHAYDVNYGFFGVFTGEQNIASALVTIGNSSLDDLYFGVIPEPGTLMLFGLLGAVVLRRRWCEGTSQLPCLGFVLLLFSAMNASALASTVITGTVTGKVTPEKQVLCGANGPADCVEQTLEEVPLSGARLCVDVPGGPCTYTLDDGSYSLLYEGERPFTVLADLTGEWVHIVRVIWIQEPYPGYWVHEPADPVYSLVTQAGQVVPFVFNDLTAPTATVEDESSTAEVNAFYYAMRTRDYFKQLDPDFEEIDVPVTVRVMDSTHLPCASGFSMNLNDPDNPFIHLTLSGDGIPPPGQETLTCANAANSDHLAYFYALFVRHQLYGTTVALYDDWAYGFGDAVALLMYDDPVVYKGYTTLDPGEVSYDWEDGEEPPVVRVDHVCLNYLHICGRVLSGVWWDIRLNLKQKYLDPQETCPPPYEGMQPEECALQIARDLNLKWIRGGHGREANIDLSLPMEILLADDDDGYPVNGTPHSKEICEATGDPTASGHNLPCPFDCNDNWIHDQDDLDDCDVGVVWCADDDGNGILDTCGTIIHVDIDATGDESGVFWETAYTDLQQAISVAQPGTDIWVAEGTYIPLGDYGGDSFELPDGVRIFGGFVGETWEGEECADPSQGCGEKLLDQRDIANNPTILSGDIGVIGDPTDNSLHVVTAFEAELGSALDGFIITGGYARGSGDDGKGGGLFITNGAPAIRNCTFIDNYATGFGGAVMISNNGPEPAYDADTIVSQCSFLGNSALTAGGALFNIGANTAVSNCIFSGNHTDFGGAAYVESGTLTFTNCTFSTNTASQSGGAVHIYSTGYATLANSIFFQNSDDDIDPLSRATVTYSLLDDFFVSGEGNIRGDPGFVDADGGDDVPGTLDDDLRLRFVSPAIDAGSNDVDTQVNTSGVQALPATDIAGNDRFVEDDCTSDTGSPANDAPYVDMGAYEFEGLQPVRLLVDAASQAQEPDGQSWEMAFTGLQDALAAVTPCLAGPSSEIWVADGTYRPVDCGPCDPSDRPATFELMTGVAIYGGFAGGAGGESTLAERDLATNEAILSGDLCGDDDSCQPPPFPPCNSENSYHVVTSRSVDETAVLDGFTITAGNADGAGVDNSGGGMYSCCEGSPTVRNCRFIGNNSYMGSGGMRVEMANPTLINCVFGGNAGGDAGAMSVDYARTTLINCTFYDNQADLTGGAGGIYHYGGCGPCETRVRNSILWRNTPSQIEDDADAVSISASIVQGGFGGVAIDQDPVFFDVYGPDGIAGTGDDNVRLTVCSPAVDSGNNGSVPADVDTDLDGNVRLVNGTVDMGAYEFGPPQPCVVYPPANAPAPFDFRKNRYVAFAPNNPGTPIAIRVEVADLVCSGAGEACSYDKDCWRCVGGPDEGEACAADDDCDPDEGGACDKDPKCVTDEGEDPASPEADDDWEAIGWVGKPCLLTPDTQIPEDTHAGLVVAFMPGFRFFDEAKVFLAGCEIQPRRSYGLSATVDGVAFSERLIVGTILEPVKNLKKWADIVGDRDPVTGLYTEPNQRLNVTDLQAIIAFTHSEPYRPHITVVDLAGELGNFKINADDLQLWLRAFNVTEDYPPHKFQVEASGAIHPRDCPVDQADAQHEKCPDVEGPPPLDPPGVPVAFSVEPISYLIDLGEPVVVDVYIDPIDDLSAYEVSLETTGGQSGELILVDITIDTERTDYVFGSATVKTAVDVASGSASAVMNSGGVEVTETSYAATFTYQASGGALGVFNVAVRDDEHDAAFLNDSDSLRVASEPGDAGVIGFGVDCMDADDCDDADDCTSNTCVDYECLFPDAPSGTSCADGLYCTRPDRCDGNGNCVGGSGDPCKGSQLCCEGGGFCYTPPERCLFQR